MCGRFTLATQPETLLDRLGIQLDGSFAPRYNIAPTQSVLAVRQPVAGQPEVASLRWGLIPFWAKDASVGYRMINARSDTAASKPAFRQALRRRRCLVLADGFYEWQMTPGSKHKQPHYIRLAQGEPFGLAGLWERWEPSDAGQEPIESCTILTTEPNSLVQPIHDRMPVILPVEAYQAWLDPHLQDPMELAQWLAPFDPTEMSVCKVSKAVNNPTHDQPDCIEPLAS